MTRTSLTSSTYSPRHMVIALTGFMGCGKSCIGRILGEMSGWRFIDLDERIEQHEGRTVRRIFSENGEPAFRRIETEALESVLDENGDRNLVLSLGGGTLTSAEAESMVSSRTFCIYLKAGIETLVHNLTLWPGDRPMLGDRPDSATLRSRIAELMSLRGETYERASHLTLEIDGMEYRAVADEIMDNVEKRKVAAER